MDDVLTRLALEVSEVARLRRGEVVQRAPRGDGSAGDYPLGVVLLPLPAAAAWDVLSQWQRIGEIVPSLSFQVAQESLDEAGVRHAIVAAEVSLAVMTMRYTCRATFDARTWRQAWSLVSPEELERLSTDHPALPRNSWMIRESTGSMELHPWEASCLLVHRNRIVPRKGLPRALEAFLTKQLVREFLAGLRRYFSEQLARGAQGAGSEAAQALGRAADAAPTS